MPCSRCSDRGHYEVVINATESPRYKGRAQRVCSCDAGLAIRYPLLTRDQIRERGLDAEVWRTDPMPEIRK